jgi:type IV secretory pathway protease TraF
MVKEMVKIHTNDPENKVITVSLSGEVRPVARLTPQMISLRGKPGETLSAEMKIVPAAFPDFTILNAAARNGRDFNFTIEKKGTPPDSYFVLTVNNQKSTAGRYFDIIELETDLNPKRIIKIRVAGYIQP